jgi:hypothetical protein
MGVNFHRGRQPFVAETISTASIVTVINNGTAPLTFCRTVCGRTQGAVRLKTAGGPETAFNEDAKAA